MHVQVALFGATLSKVEKESYKRSISTLGTDNLKNTFPDEDNSDDNDDAEEGEDYAESMINSVPK